jgi:CRP/FNR family transcriptional regulator
MLGNDDQLGVFVNLFKKGTKLSYDKGEYIVRPGESPSSVYYIESGLVKAFNITKYGEENLLIIRKSHQLFPLIWAVTNVGREVVYQTLVPTTLYRIDRDTFTDYLHKNPDCLYSFIDLITEQYQIHSERIMNLEYRTVRERLASFLLTMATHYGREFKSGMLIEVPLKQQDIASSISASRETASREVSALERKGFIEKKQTCVFIKDPKALKKLL